MRVFRTIDQLLRGRLAGPQEGGIEIRTKTLLVAVAILGVAYGAFMGLYAALRGGSHAALQMAASMAKVPLLFVLTLVVTFPSLYVFSSLARSRLTFEATLRLLLSAITVNMALLASFGPVTGFFTLSTESYPFMVVLNVVFFAISGLIGLSFLRSSLSGVFEGESVLPRAAWQVPPAQDTDTSRSPVEPAKPRAGGAARDVFRLWTLIYAVVGAQMGWILRPFVGDPGRPFQLFRERQGNFFIAVLEALESLFR
jgi:hypothetical protein